MFITTLISFSLSKFDRNCYRQSNPLPSNMSWSSPKAQVTGSQTGVTGSAHEQSVRRRRTKLTSEKKIAKDEFMAAAVGDVEWLKQSLKAAGPGVAYDKNVRNHPIFFDVDGCICLAHITVKQMY